MAEKKIYIVQKVEPFKEKIQRMNKTWITARTAAQPSQKHQNSMLEFCYHEWISKLKTLYMSLPNDLDRAYFEKDYKRDNIENSLAMHSFLTTSVHLHLDCYPNYFYRIEYDFYNCPFEDQLMEWINTRNNYIPDSCRRRQLKPNCKEYFQRVQKVQEEKYFSILPFTRISSENNLKCS